MLKNKLKGYINVAKKASYVIIGRDNIELLKNKKFYLFVLSSSASKSLVDFADNLSKEKNCEFIKLNKLSLDELIDITNCKIIGIKNKNLSLIIKDLIEKCEG